MTTVTVSTKYQVVIPAAIRQRLGLRPGKKYQVISYGDCIEFVRNSSAPGRSRLALCGKN